MSNRRALDPEVAELLVEVARDPRSHLLRVPDVENLPAFEPAVGVAEPFLTSAERKLLEVRRSEVAQLLLEATIREVYEHPKASWELTRTRDGGSKLKVADLTELRRRSRRQLEAPPEAADDLEAVSLLARCLGPMRPREAGVKLALASLRLRPREETRIYLALALDQAGRTRTALDLLHRQIRVGYSAGNGSFLWRDLGLFEWKLGRPEASMQAYRSTVESNGSQVAAAFDWFVVALLIGYLESALEAARILEERASPDHPATQEFIGLYQGRRARGMWKPTPEFRRVVSGIRDSLPPVARRVCHAFL